MILPRVLHSYSHYITYYSKIFFLCSICFVTYYGFLRTETDYSKHPHFIYLQAKNQQNSECVIPEVDPWDPSILSYYSKPSSLVCSPVQVQAVKSFENGIITLFQFDESLVKNAKCYKVELSHDENVTDLDVKYGTAVLLDLSKSLTVEIPEEMFQISCESDNMLKTEFFKYHYAQIIPKKANLKNKQIQESTPDFPSVIMIGLDSMSRSNFIRQMPKTYKYMKDSGFIDMKGHMKIHDNTYGNLLAILTGKRGVSVQEFKAEMNESWHIAFDEYDFVWKTFSENGYATLFSEDRPDIGTFTYKNLLRGFLQQPTDHYLRPFWISAFWSLISRRSAASCYDNKPQHKIQLEYIEKFLEKYEKKRKFAFWWSQDMSHGFLNLIGRTDDDFEEFFKKNEKRLEDSVVIVFSDHGHRYDKIRETVIGRIESRMPFHSIKIPDAVTKKYPFIIQNLIANSKLMTTQFDVNDSLRKIASGRIGETITRTDLKRSYSYFDPFPKRTGCFEAGIPSDFCPCFSEIEIPKTEALEAAGELMIIVNELLENTEQTEEYEQDSKELKEYMCTPMEFNNIEYSSVRLPMLSVVNDIKSVDTPLQSFSLQYHIVVRAKPPSNALIESTLEHNLKTDTWSSLGEIERNNKYGNTSFCVNDRILKKICHCISRKTDPATAIL
ncbi:Protein CBG09618 [Caenorhabditis briggsae]|uniref:Protein CBG09618 n=1 Tax=Caenorhabditis briggsae TaxID=6238 RepID=A8X8N2_CAEBR|nr:Protein CBG09618 [Caenorhabditis briggsae]CAP28993.2 Protein CBG09618 [Caenorhabditis briggsae]